MKNHYYYQQFWEAEKRQKKRIDLTEPDRHLFEEWKRINLKSNMKKIYCPSCGTVLTVKHGKKGIFYSCLNFPTCMYSRDLTADELTIYNNQYGFEIIIDDDNEAD